MIRKLSSLFDIILEVPEGTFWSLCNVTPDVPDDSAGGFARAMLYNPMPEEDEKKTANTWLRGHSDASFLTFITSQPMASLQVRDYKDGEWKWVGYRENALVVNVADCLEFLSGSYFKSTIHRVVSPPDDQKGHRRLGFSEFRDSLSVFVCTASGPKLISSLLDFQPSLLFRVQATRSRRSEHAQVAQTRPTRHHQAGFVGPDHGARVGRSQGQDVWEEGYQRH